MDKKIKIVLVIIGIIIILGGIIMFAIKAGKDENTNSNKMTTTSSSKTSNSSQNNTNENKTSDNNVKEEKTDYKKSAEKQMSTPKEGDTIAIIHVKKYGDIKVKFFEDVAPKAVKNFTTHAKDGYYDGVIFHRVINEFMIQGGDPLGTGYGGESIWGEGFEEELSEELVPYRGSLCMASAGTGTSSLGSQFFITQAHYDEETAKMFKQYNWPTDLIDMYKEYGGYMSLYQGYTVFGQVIEGMDVVDKIAKAKTNSNDKPLEDIKIETIEITKYKK